MTGTLLKIDKTTNYHNFGYYIKVMPALCNILHTEPNIEPIRTYAIYY